MSDARDESEPPTAAAERRDATVPFPGYAPAPVLAYDVDPAFGWADDGPEAATLRLPHGPAWEGPAELAAALVLSTGFLLLYVVAVVIAVREPGGGSDGTRVVGVLVGLFAIGQWVLVLRRFADHVRPQERVARVAVSRSGIDVTGALLPGPRAASWPRGDVAGLRLDVVRGGSLRMTRRARLQVAQPDGTVSAIVVPWPPSEPTEPHEARVRGLLGLPPRAGGGVDAAG
ncbi:MAG TPA: hypothetical protein VF796_09525 [Humisphaera sp.]